jgi:hypothetical protein
VSDLMSSSGALTMKNDGRLATRRRLAPWTNLEASATQ